MRFAWIAAEKAEFRGVRLLPSPARLAEHAKEALFVYIEVFYNRRRRHFTLGQISPAELERRPTHAA
jgi:transposase InsO family protein